MSPKEKNFFSAMPISLLMQITARLNDSHTRAGIQLGTEKLWRTRIDQVSTETMGSARLAVPDRQPSRLSANHDANRHSHTSVMLELQTEHRDI